MNDRFQFRVFDKDKNEYVEKGYIHRWGYLVMPTMKNDYSLAEAEGNFVIEQCTGLKDKNGNLIYEGDILGGVFEGLYIGWCDECKQLNLKDQLGECMACLGDMHWCDLVEDDGKIEVIGNIHENKELLDER